MSNTKSAQSISICAPGGTHCCNNCEFCVAKMHENVEENSIFKGVNPNFMQEVDEYIRRLKYAKEAGTDTLIITGRLEPLQSITFLQQLAFILNKFNMEPCGGFHKTEVQTSGVGLTPDMASFLRHSLGVNMISLSLASLDSNMNRHLVHIPDRLYRSIEETCAIIRNAGLDLRISLNMSEFMLDSFNSSCKTLFQKVKDLGACQLTVRKLYCTGNSPQSQWVRKYADAGSRRLCNFFEELTYYIRRDGMLLEKLPYGYDKYLVNGISVVVDTDSMSEESAEKEVSKYFVLYPDGKLYSDWNRENFVF